jgi:hypothetical protein
VIDRRVFLAGATATLACRSGPVPRAIEDGVAALRRLQATDGSFPSPVVGLLRSGHTTTPLAALALLAVGVGVDEDTHRFLASARDDEGALGRSGLGIEYPVYATALALSVAAAAGRPESERAPLRAFLLGQQLIDSWDGHPAEGGFPIGARIRPSPPDFGHVDLSMTRTAAEALAADGHPSSAAALAGVARYTRRSVGLGGGFVYSAPEPGLNKGGCTDDGCRSYGTATTDGLRAMLACGYTVDDPTVRDAWSWWKANLDVKRNPGLQEGNFKMFADPMRGYWWWGAAVVAARLGAPPGWLAALQAEVAATRRPDGSWANASALQKEDCPVVATSLALLALSAREA